MTWASTSVGRTVARTGVFLKRQLWVWPILAVVVLSILGITVRGAMETTIKENLSSALGTLLTAEAAMLEKWLDVHASNAESAANDPHVREIVHGLLETAEPGEATGRTSNLGEKELANVLGPLMTAHDFVGFFVADRSKTILTSSHPALVGQRDVTQYDAFLERALDGESLVSVPFASVVMMQDASGRTRTGVPTMYACAPLRDENFQVVACLALQLRPEEEFSEILQLGMIGKSGETYAFDRQGVMVSRSRFDDELILLGILADNEQSRSILQVLVRDPQGDMTKGYRPDQRRSAMPLTKMAAEAVEGRSGLDVEGYRDYRGVMVVGAWTWLPKYQLGVATEVDQAEAFRSLTILRRAFWILYFLLIASSVAIFVFTVIVARLQRQARKAAIDAQRLGQYTLEEKLGSGAMGVVYKGRHSMLHRPTAIKLLDADTVDDEAIQRFEREVQITCRLNHPSTIAIYDFGRTPEGVFYYAMEYLDGIDLQKLVDRYGRLPAGRVISILLQVCGSLFEAHSQGLVHRDIKPANIMLSRRGGEPDVVKVLDFGLVKGIEDAKPAGASGGLTGTPLYMSPESIQSPASVDARSDLYSVGAVGYFLLTGMPVFEARGVAELCQMHLDEHPVPPGQRAKVQVSEALEHAILSCLEKSRAKRPQTARDLAHMLRQCPEATSWTREEADAWWSRRERGQTEPSEVSRDTAGGNSGLDQTVVRG